MIQPLLTTVHYFLYVQIRFRTFRIATTPSWNNRNNITNVPTKLYPSQTKRISVSHHFISSQIRLPALSLRECKLIFRLVLWGINVGRIYSSITNNLKFDWSIQVTWKQRVLINQIRLNIFAGITARKLKNIPAVTSSYPCRSKCFIFTKQIIVLFRAIIYSYLQRFFKIGVLKTLYTIYTKTTESEPLFNQPVVCYFFNKRLQHRCFLMDILKLSRTPFLQEHFDTPDSVFMEHICYYNIIKFNVNKPKWLFQLFETLIKTKMYICEIKITWTWKIILFLLFWFWKICYYVWLTLSWLRFLSYTNQSTDLHKIPYLNTNLNWNT